MTTSAPPAAAAASPAILRAHIPLSVIVAIACTCGFMAVMDSSIVNVALPTIRDTLHLSTTQYGWVVNAYLLTLGGFLLLSARASDLFGRKLVLQTGIAIFTLASLAGGLSFDGTMLVGARALQGVGGSILAPAGLGLILSTHTEPSAKARAMSFYAATASIAAAVGVVLGGVLTQEASWRWVMFVNVPVGVLLLAGVGVTLAPSQRDHGAHLDIPGALAIVTGMAALIYGLSEAPDVGWGAARVLIALFGAVVLIGGFVTIESRTAAPLVRLGVFRARNLTVGNLVLACLGVVLTAAVFFLSRILQQDLGYDALRTGLAMTPFALAVTATSLAAPRLIRHSSARTVAACGGLIATIGFAWLGLMPNHPLYASNLLAPLIIAGAGMGLMLMPSSNAATAGLPPQEAGLAAGLFNMSRQLGAAVGLAALLTLSSTVTRHARTHHSTLLAGLHGNTVALLATAAVALGAALLALCLNQQR